MSGNLKTDAADFWSDTVTCWKQLPNKLFFFSLLAAWLALFQFFGNSIYGYNATHSIFVWLYNIYNSPNPANDDGYGNLIPFVVIGLFWWKRKELLAQRLEMWWPGIFFVIAAVLIHVAGFAVQQPRLAVIALFIGIFGLMGMAWGRAWLKHGFFPFWLFMFSMPLAALTLPVTFPLRILSSWLTATVAHLLTIDVVRVGTQLMSGDGTYQFDVAAACSGMRSLVAIFLLATIYGFVTFRSVWKRGLLMALAFPLSVLGNFTRLMCIIIAAEFGGQSAGNFVHENTFFSLLPYVPAIAGLLWAGHLLSGKKSKNSTAPEPPAESAEAATSQSK